MSAAALATDWPAIDETPLAPAETSGILARLAEVVFDASKPPPDEPVVFSIAGVEICHPGNITVIEAHLKAGKSAFVSAGIASIFAPAGVDCLGWRSDANPRDGAVLHLDTEQSRGDHHRLVARALTRAGRSSKPECLTSYCLTGWGCADMQAAVESAIAQAVAKFGGVHSLWLDGAADLVQSPNDEREAFAFVRWLQSLAIAHRCPVIVVLHLNPGDAGKSRGHLGSELNRKAEAVLRLTKDANDLSSVTTQWTRHAPILKRNAPCFAWSDENGRHMTVASAGDTKDASELAEVGKIIAAVWRDDRKAVRKHHELVQAVAHHLEKSDATAKRKIGFMQRMNLVKKAGGGVGYVLTAEGSQYCEPDEAA
jgi:hypothetical protein